MVEWLHQGNNSSGSSMHQSTSKGIIYKALAVLDFMQCLIGFSKRGCCHDTCDVEVVVVQFSIRWCSISGVTSSCVDSIPQSLSSSTFSWSDRQLLREATRKAREHSTLEKTTRRRKSNNTSEAIRDTRLSPLGGCPISSGQRITSGGLLSTSLSHGQASMALG